MWLCTAKTRQLAQHASLIIWILVEECIGYRLQMH